MAAILTACVAGPVLLPKSAVVPAGVDLSGDWQLLEESSDIARHKVAAGREATGAGEDIVKIARKGESSDSKNTSLLHVFLESGSLLRITQTPYGVFVSFDRAIVEEYTFGEHRPVSVGPVVAERVSGWEDRHFVVETADDKGNKLIEHYWLEDGGDTLHRRITLLRNNDRELDVEQAFARKQKSG